MRPPPRKSTASGKTSALKREQQRLAQLLHDTVCQELTGLCFLASASAHQQQRAANAEAAAKFAELSDLIQRTGANLAKIVHSLREPS